ncbi:MAG TPA: CHAD domain-containing protein, partial [Burkholderiales bacterium]|nr:CHAD domain-containing protein [Burkholderiales bacterium]
SSTRFQILMLNLGALLSGKSWPQGESLALEHFARDLLERRYRSFRKAGRNIERLSHGELHALRISGKKLRYAAEFFSPLYPAHAARDFLKAMAGIQDVLGAINDAATTNHLLDELSDTDRGGKCLVRGWVGCGTVHSLSRAGLQWKAFKTVVPFWK